MQLLVRLALNPGSAVLPMNFIFIMKEEGMGLGQIQEHPATAQILGILEMLKANVPKRNEADWPAPVKASGKLKPWSTSSRLFITISADDAVVHIAKYTAGTRYACHCHISLLLCRIVPMPGMLWSCHRCNISKIALK